MEDKQKICDLLLPALQATRGLRDLADLEYVPEADMVYATFLSGRVKKVNVAFRSGIAIIRDILEQII